MKISFYLLIISVTLFMFGCNGEKKSTSPGSKEMDNPSITKPDENKKSNSNQSTTGYTLNKNELSILSFMIKDDLQKFLTGSENSLKTDVLVASVEELAKVFKENNVVSGQKFLKNRVGIYGKIGAIKSENSDEKYLVFEGDNELEARFVNGRIVTSSNLNKGDTISIVCDVAESGKLINCESGEEWITKYESSIVNDYLGLLAGKKKMELNLALLPVLVIAITRELNAESDCFNSGKNCQKDFELAYSKVKRERIESIVDELIEKGVKVPRMKK